MFLRSRRCPRVALSTSSVSAQPSPPSRVQRALLKPRHPISGRKIASKCARHPTRQPRMVGRAIKLTMSKPPARVGAQQTTPIDSIEAVCDLCAFEVLLHVTGQQSTLLSPKDARITMYTRTATVTHCENEATCPGADCIPGGSVTVDASGNERVSPLQNGD